MSSDEADWLLWGGSVVQVSGLEEKIALSYSRGTKTAEVDIIISITILGTQREVDSTSYDLVIGIVHILTISVNSVKNMYKQLLFLILVFLNMSFLHLACTTGQGVNVQSELMVLNSIVLPHKELNTDFRNQIIL